MFVFTMTFNYWITITARKLPYLFNTVHLSDECPLTQVKNENTASFTDGESKYIIFHK